MLIINSCGRKVGVYMCSSTVPTVCILGEPENSSCIEILDSKVKYSLSLKKKKKLLLLRNGSLEPVGVVCLPSRAQGRLQWWHWFANKMVCLGFPWDVHKADSSVFLLSSSKAVFSEVLLVLG